MAHRLRYYVIRPDSSSRAHNGPEAEQALSLVPLIAVDELPEWLELIGVPRQLTLEQAASMTNLGYVEEQAAFDVDILLDDAGVSSTVGTESSKFPSADSAAAQGRHGSETGQYQVASPSHDTNIPPTIPSTVQPAVQPRRAAVAAPTTPSSPPKPTQTAVAATATATATATNTYCRHWVVHGTCKWGPYCRYAHTMPATPDGLAECGLADFPPWWTAAMGLTMTGLQRRSGGGVSGRKAAMAGVMPGGYGLGMGMGVGVGLPVSVPFAAYGRYGGRERRVREMHPVHDRGRGKGKGKGKGLDGAGVLVPAMAKMEMGRRESVKGQMGGLGSVVEEHRKKGGAGADGVEHPVGLVQGQAQVVREQVQPQEKLVDV